MLALLLLLIQATVAPPWNVATHMVTGGVAYKALRDAPVALTLARGAEDNPGAAWVGVPQATRPASTSHGVQGRTSGSGSAPAWARDRTASTAARQRSGS